MKLAEALRIVRAQNPEAPEFPVALLSGSTAEPLSHFLAAHLHGRLAQHRVTIEAGRFGDLAGNLARYLENPRGPGALVLEWCDLDPRLGLRQPGSWGRAVVSDVLATTGRQLDRLAALLSQLPAGALVAIAPPGLPLPPLVPTPADQLHPLEAGLYSRMSRFLAQASELESVRVLSPAHMASTSPADRLDVRSWLQAGFPYRLAYVSALAGWLASLLAPKAPAKGLITDLDNTFWDGILGEVGPDRISWHLEQHTSLHGTYQQFLQSLAVDGVLIAVASKNDRALVDRALSRPDLLMPPASLFPIEAHWQPKPESVARILDAWNIGADSVVFLDDSPMEVAAVKAAFPTMDCRQFPSGDPDALWVLLEELRNRFGKPARREEDALRLESLRANADRRTLISTGSSEDDLLRDAGGVLTITRLTPPPDPRALELVNKTNQFNLNGRRYTETEWAEYLSRPETSVWMASYSDRFGPLGKIAVLGATRREGSLEIDCWVLSCRAFSRRIEHAMLQFLFDCAGVEEVLPRFQSTERNTPLREFLEAITGAPASVAAISRNRFEAPKPPAYLSIETNVPT